MTDTTEAQEATTFTYRAEMKQLLHLIVHSLYTHREIFLRELISNASDALHKARLRTLTDQETTDRDAVLEIDIRPDTAAGMLIIEDTGIGMTREDLVERIGTIASSGTAAFLEELQKSSDAPVDADLIGQFGVGFYAAFMVADRIEIETRHGAADAESLRWTSDGEGTFTITEGSRSHRGTEIRLLLKEDAKEFAEAYRIKDVIRKYSNFVEFPIRVEGEQVNKVKALWHRQKDGISEEELNAFYQFVAATSEDPLGHLHLQLDGQVNVRALLFVPKTAPRNLFREEELRGPQLYASRVFIQDDCKDLLPEYLRFARGVVDTDDLPLNVSREVTQNSAVTARIRSILTGKLLGMLEEWAAEEDPQRFKTFYEAFGTLFKTGLTSDFKNREKLLPLLRFESTVADAGTLVGFGEYVSRMQEDQKTIYYLTAESREAAERNPNLEYFRKREIEVLLMVDPVDVFVVPAIGTFEEKTLESIDRADLDLGSTDADDGEVLGKKDLKKLIDRFKSVLGERVEDVVASKRLVNSAATLVVGKQGVDVQMERMMRMMGQDVPKGKKVLEINPAHVLVHNLSRLRAEPGREAAVERTILQLFEGALLLDGTLEEPADYVARMTELMIEATA